MNDSQLRQDLRALSPTVNEAEAWTVLVRRMRRDQRRRRTLAVAAVALVAGALGAVIAAVPKEQVQTESADEPAATSTTEPITGARWTRLDADVALVPFSGEPVVELTNGGLLIWGRTSQAQLDPTTGAERRLPDAPIRPRDDAAGAWTGSELIVWGGLDEVDGAAYDLAADKWREIAPSPLRRGKPVAAVWTGDEVLIWGGLPDGANNGAAYNPTTDSWRRIADAPFGIARGTAVQTSPGTLVVLGSPQGPEVNARQAQALQYDIESDSWTLLPEPDLSPNATWMVWTGTEVIAWDYLLEARSWTPGAASWEPLPDLPLDGRECYPGGGFSPEVGVLVTYCDQVAVLDPNDREWTKEEMPFDVPVDGQERELFGPVAQTGGNGLFLLTSQGGLLFR